MNYDYILHPFAQEEYEDSVFWYYNRSTIAGASFVNAIDDAIKRICTNPQQFKKTYHDFREAVLTSFPFTIVFKIEESAFVIIIIAIYHQNRKPENKYR